MSVLITGFDPFGGEPVNPALEAVKKLDGLTLAGAQVHTVEIHSAAEGHRQSEGSHRCL